MLYKHNIVKWGNGNKEKNSGVGQDSIPPLHPGLFVRDVSGNPPLVNSHVLFLLSNLNADNFGSRM